VLRWYKYYFFEYQLFRCSERKIRITNGYNNGEYMPIHTTELKYIGRHLFIFYLFLYSVCLAFPTAVKIQDTVVDTQAMTLGAGAPYGYAINGLSFQQEALVTFNGWQYAVYYNSSRRVCLARRQLPSGAWSVIPFTDYTLSTTTDAHNVVTIGICPNDGTIHLSFDHHGGSLHYRVSQPGAASHPDSVVWNAALFGPVRSYLIAGQTITSVTYPRFWQTPDGNLQFGFRAGASGNGDWYMADYTADDGLWSNVRQVINRSGTYTDSLGTSTTRNAYMNPLVYGPDGILHATWTWRESAGGANHDIVYAWSPDGGFHWYNNNVAAGFRIGTGSSPLQTLLSVTWINEGLQLIGKATGSTTTQQLITVHSSNAAVIAVDRYYGIMNQQAQAVDAQGRIHTIMFHCTPETYEGYSYSTWGPQGARRYYHYWRNAKGIWTRNELPGWVGSRPKLFIRSNGDAYVIYQSRRNVNPTDTGIYFTDGDLTIQAATAASSWTDWQIIHIEPGYFFSEALADPYRFQDGVLSVVMQESPSTIGGASRLRILDFELN